MGGSDACPRVKYLACIFQPRRDHLPSDGYATGDGADGRHDFFVTSNGIGNGGNLGGIAGADNHCQKLAQAAGAGAPKTWRAYLSTQAADGKPRSTRATASARDRGRMPKAS